MGNSMMLHQARLDHLGTGPDAEAHRWEVYWDIAWTAPMREGGWARDCAPRCSCSLSGLELALAVQNHPPARQDDSPGIAVLP